MIKKSKETNFIFIKVGNTADDDTNRKRGDATFHEGA